MIRVNDVEIDNAMITAEMQYHRGRSHEEVKCKATEALIVATLVRQQVGEAGNEVELDTLMKRWEDSDASALVASEDDCRLYYQNNQKRFISSPLLEARHILLSATREDQERRSTALQQARELIAEIRQAPEQFGMFAMQFSACPSKEDGGQLGQLTKGQTVPEFERQLFNCPQGLVSSPIETRYGIHIVWIDHFEPGKLLPFESVHQKIAHYLMDRLQFKSIAHNIQQLIDDASIEGYDMAQSQSPLIQ